MVALQQKKEFKKLHFFATVVPENISLSEAPMAAKPIVMYDSSAAGAVAFRALAVEVLAALGRLRR
jgi:chromosome partitioning protein